MKMHRPKGTADWSGISLRKRNRWQRLAARTHGYVTIGNLVTLLGVLLVAIGGIAVLRHAYILGFITIGAGRLCDLLDGWLAELTQTKSYVGATFDVVADKLTGLYILLILASGNLMPWWAAIGFIIIQSLTSIASSLVLSRLIPIYPVATGKLGMAVIWAGVLAYVIAALFDGVGGGLIRLVATCLVLVAWALSGHACVQYWRQYFSIRSGESAKPKPAK